MTTPTEASLKLAREFMEKLTGVMGSDLFPYTREIGELALLLDRVRAEALEEAAKVCWRYSAKRDGDCSKNYAKGFVNGAHDGGVASRTAESLCNDIRALIPKGDA